MIKFIRKFRLTLFIQNQFRKYLFYAISEISLIVLGILIALQINNWNIKRAEEYSDTDILNQPQQDYTEFKKKKIQLSSAEYAVNKNGVLHYLQDSNKDRTYLLWIYNGETFIAPTKKDLPDGFHFVTAHYFNAVDFTLTPSKYWNVISDNVGNIYMRIH